MLRKTFFCLSLWFFICCAGSKEVHAITITPAQPGADLTFDAQENYTLPINQQWSVNLNPTSVTLLPRGGTEGFVDLLADQFVPNGWSFASAANDLPGQFNIDVYDAFHSGGAVGAVFVMNYVPGVNDPFTTSGSIFHWIQRVVDNHAITGNHGDLENVIDATLSAPFTSPSRLFYDFDVDFATPPRFRDASSREDFNSHYWHAELYLTSIPNAGSKNVTIYNGVAWGWTNQPVPGPLPIMGIGVAYRFSRKIRKRIKDLKP